MELYYKPSSHGVRDLRIVVTDSMPDTVKEAQRDIARSHGMFLVDNATPPKASFFETYKNEIKPVTDESGEVTGYRCEWTATPRKIVLSQQKLVEDKGLAPIMPSLISAIKNNPELSKWWASDMTYVRGSDMAKLAMSAFGMTQEELERVVFRCRL